MAKFAGMRLVVAVELAFLILVTGCASSPASWIVPDQSQVAGKPLAEFTALWWQWAYSMDLDASAVRDTNGEFCDVGQRGDVWFLAGGYGTSKIQRACIVPAGKSIFFPVINMVYSPRFPGSVTCDEAQQAAALHNDSALALYLEIDGVVMPKKAIHRLKSPDCFNLAERIPASEGPTEVLPSAADGYWVMMKPLPKGLHKIAFSARYNRPGGAFGQMAQDIEYDLLVE